MSWLIVLEIIVGLICGGWVAYRLGGFIRSLVVRSMPIEKRISDESYYIQTRASTVIAFIVALGVAGAVFWGAETAKQALADGSAITQQQTVLTTDLQPLPTETTPPPEDISQPPAPAREEPNKVITPAASSHTSPTPYSAAKSTYYLQLGAYSIHESAAIQVGHFQQRLPVSVQLISLLGTKGPNKVMAGPFDSRNSAQGFRLQHQLKDAFVRKHP